MLVGELAHQSSSDGDVVMRTLASCSRAIEVLRIL